MAVNIFVLMVMTALANLPMKTQSDALRITLSPERCIGPLQEDVKISCVSEGGNKQNKDVTLIEIRRNNENPLAFLKDCNNITKRRDLSNRMQASGFIDKETGLNNLTVTLRNPETEDDGVYTCLMYYLDQDGNLRQEKSSANFVVEKLDVLSLEKNLKMLRNKISDLETNFEIDLQEKNDNLSERIVSVEKQSQKAILDLEEENKRLTETMRAMEEYYKNETRALKEKDTATTAFCASFYNGHHPLSESQTVVFPQVTVNQGDGYNASTGVFTAPTTGLYAFHLVARKYKREQYLQFEVDTRESTVGRLTLRDKEAEIQSSISVVVDLEAGDWVKVVLVYLYRSSWIYGGPETLFSGYLISPR